MVYLIGHCLTAIIMGLLMAVAWTAWAEAGGPDAPWLVAGGTAFAVRLACWAHLGDD